MKIGSPAMTVTSRTRNNTYLCTWYEHDELNAFEFFDHQITDVDPARKKSVGRSGFFRISSLISWFRHGKGSVPA